MCSSMQTRTVTGLGEASARLRCRLGTGAQRSDAVLGPRLSRSHPFSPQKSESSALHKNGDTQGVTPPVFQCSSSPLRITLPRAPAAGPGNPQLSQSPRRPCDVPRRVCPSALGYLFTGASAKMHVSPRRKDGRLGLTVSWLANSLA